MVPFGFKIIKRTFKVILTSFFLLTFNACSDKQIGQELAQSFDDQAGPVKLENQNKVEKLDEKKKITSGKLKIKSVQNDIDSNVKLNLPDKETKKFIKNRKVQENEIFSVPFTPSPYRITIKLSEANPSAPAEVVTRALRKAGIIFEVERIERIQVQRKNKSSNFN